jgi:2'-5' RNA ligase
MHITIKFLGRCEVSVIDRMNERLDKVVGSISSFDFVLSSIGVFPSVKRARVLWAGAGDGFREFRELAKKTDDKFIKLGFIPEKRPFHPHVTLARIRDPHPVDEQVLEHAGLSLPEDKITAGSLILFESKLSPKGATYIKVSEHLFKK